MRFKAKLAPEQLAMLYQVILPLSKIAATGASEGGGTSNSIWTRNGSFLHLDESTLRLSTKGKSGADSGAENVQCFAEVDATNGGIFLEHRIESAANNAILMELDLAQFRIALQSICSDHRSSLEQRQNQYTILKLAKRNGIPCLELDAFTSSPVVGEGGSQSHNGGDSGRGLMMQMHHSIPVRILRPSEMTHHLPPQIADPTVQLALEKPLRPVVEGLRALSQSIYLHATSAGELTLSVDNDGASIRAFLQNAQSQQENNGGQESAECTVKVDTKKLCSTLQWQQPNTPWVSKVLLCLVENEMLVLHVALHPSSVGFFTYYIPVQYLPKDVAEE